MNDDTNVPTLPTPSSAYISTETKAFLARQLRKVLLYNLVLAGFVLCNIIVLYVLHFVDRHDIHNSFGSSGAGGGAATFKVDDLKPGHNGKVVSFAPSGQVVVGAGTTAYLNAAQLPNDNQLVWMDLLPLGTSSSQKQHKTNLMTYSFQEDKANASSIRSFVTTVTVNDDKTVSVPTGTMLTLAGYQLKRGATLSNSLAVFLLENQSRGLENVTNSIVLGRISSDGRVTIDEDNVLKDAVKFSAETYVSRLSDTTFALSYYGKYELGGKWAQYTQVGSVSNGNQISLSEPIPFAPDNTDTSFNQINAPQPIVEDGRRFVVPWYTTNSTKGLCLTVFDYSGASGNLNATGEEVCDADYRPAYNMHTTSLTENSFALAFYNQADNYALTVATIQLGAYNKLPVFRGSFVVDISRGAFDFGNSNGFNPNPTLSLLSGQRLAVAFMNPSNDGKPSVEIVGFGSDLSLTSIASAMPVSQADFGLANKNAIRAAGALYMDSVATDNGVLVGYGGLWDNKAIGGLPLVESLGKPLGIVSGDKIAFYGVVKMDNLTVGTSYYASTCGKVVGATGEREGAFIYANDETVVSTDSFVGVAVESDKLYMSSLQAF